MAERNDTSASAATPPPPTTGKSKSSSSSKSLSAALGRDGRDYTHVSAHDVHSSPSKSSVAKTRNSEASLGRVGSSGRRNAEQKEAAIAGANRWRPPTPPPAEERKQPSWFGSLLSSGKRGSRTNDDDDNDENSGRYTSFADGNNIGMHPEQLVTARIMASASKKRSRLAKPAGSKGRQLISPSDGGASELGPDAPAADQVALDANADVDDFDEELHQQTQNTSQSASVEADERIRAECGFFYTDLDDDPQRKTSELMQARHSGHLGRGRYGRNRGRGRRFGLDDGGEGDGGLEYAAAADDGSMVLDLETGRHHYEHPSYHNAEERHAFLERYESLNAHHTAPSRSRHRLGLPGNDHDLRLAEDGSGEDGSLSSSSVYSSAVASLQSCVGGGMLDEPPSPSSRAIRSDSLRQSSLLYIHSQSGMVQLRLPNDNVRLLMDPHLEPGILSVEQVPYLPATTDTLGLPSMPALGMSRSQDSSEDANGLDAAALDSFPSNKRLLDEEESPTGAAEKDLSGNKMSCAWDNEPSYVLTVDDDLYRRLVKEMADSKMICGCYYCFHHTDGEQSPSIGIALFVLFIVFALLLAETIIHPT